MFKVYSSFLVLVLLLNAAGLGPSAYGAPTGSPSKDWEYPELLVTPRASERLEREAKIDARKSWKVYWPLQVSALGTLSAGVMQLSGTDPSSDPDKKAAFTGIGVGAGWLVATWLLAENYRPYASGVEEIAALPKASQRDQLTRERIAEEAIENASSMARRLRWLSVLSNFATAAYMAGNAQDGSLAKTVDVVAVGLAFTPMIFPSRWISVARAQEDYKKKIFGPITQIIPSTVWIRTSVASASPGLGLQFRF